MSSQEHEVVISGIAGTFPDCRNINEFKEKLFSKEILVKKDVSRWIPNENDKPYTAGLMKDWNKVDNGLFGLSFHLMKNSDPFLGSMIERTFEALVDAGINPYKYKGANATVIAGTDISASESTCFKDLFTKGSGMVGFSRAMYANRISFFFDLKGPSYCHTSSWVSSMEALQMAATMVAQGQVDSAIVTTCNLLQHNAIDVEYRAMNILTENGKCSPFDAKASGVARSEAAVTFILQRAADAKRHYCTVMDSRVELRGDRSSSLVNPRMESFLKEFYSSCPVNPTDVAYVEAFGSGVKEFDAAELNGLASVFGGLHKTPLQVGSVTGNIGNTEGCTGLVSLTKAIIALETGMIPPTVNYDTPNPDVPALLSGKLQPVTAATPLRGDVVAVNNFNFVGAVGHTVVKRKSNVERMADDGLPRLVILQARDEDSVRSVIEKISSKSGELEYFSLVNDVFKDPFHAYLWRSYAIIPGVDRACESNSKLKDPKIRPLWFVFSGMGSQWTGMGRDLLQIPAFATAVDRCDKVLRPRGIDIKDILTTDDETIFDNILNCFVGIAAVQVGLVDILRTLGVTPDGMVGHSVGELGCAYADNCVTAEEMVLCAWARGKASLEGTDEVKGMMAAVGLGYNDVHDQLPPSIDVACHNSHDSSTLSGPTPDIISFVDQLKSKRVFAKAVSAGGIAYHSRYIKTIAPKLLEYLKQILPSPKPRSSRWISSSVPEAQWEGVDARLCSAEYHTNNLLSPVLFQEACQHVPKDAILLEIAPHGLLQAILRRSISSDMISLSMTSRTAGSNLHHLLKTIGELHLNNVPVDVNALYPPVTYPVPRGTPSLVDVVSWSHTEEWYKSVSFALRQCLQGIARNNDVISTTAPDYRLWKDHVVEGRVMVPTAQLLMYPWRKRFSSKLLEEGEQEESAVTMENINVNQNVFVNEQDSEIFVSLLGASNFFEVAFEGSTFNSKQIITGKLYETTCVNIYTPEASVDTSELEVVEEDEVYCLLAQLGYQLGPQFRSIMQILLGQTESIAQVRWSGNIVTFLDALMKIIVLVESDRRDSALQISNITKLTVNTPHLKSLPPGTVMEVYYDSRCGHLLCEAVELAGVVLSPATYKQPSTLVFRESRLQPYFDNIKSGEEFLSTCIQLAADLSLDSWTRKTTKVDVLVVCSERFNALAFTGFLGDVIRSCPFLKVRIFEVDASTSSELVTVSGQTCPMVVGDYRTLAALVDSSSDNTYFLCPATGARENTFGKKLKAILMHESDDVKMVLLKKVSSAVRMKVVEVQGPEWLSRVRHLVASDVSDQPVAVVSRSLSPRQVLPTLAAEPYRHRLRTVFIQDQAAPQFNLSSPLYSAQLALGLPVNILTRGVWATRRTMGLTLTPQQYNYASITKSQKNGLEVSCLSLNPTTFTVGDDEEPEVRFVDYSGQLAGERVMGVAQLSPESDTLSPDVILTWPVPADWSLEDAATVPVLYTMAYYCMQLTASLGPGETVLVHAGMSPLGQALIAVSLQLKGTVIASVRNDREASQLLKCFPSIKRSHIVVLNNQNRNAEVEVMRLTAGKGVQVIVNCLRGRHMQTSVRLMGHDCRFLHLGRVRVEDRESIGMLVFLKRTSFSGVSLDNLGDCDRDVKQKLREAVLTGVQLGAVKPTTRTAFRFKNTTEALKHFKTTKTEIKTILTTDQEWTNNSKNLQCHSDRTCIIAGTRTELWLDVAEWLVDQGVHRLAVLTEEHQLVDSQVRRFNKLVNRLKYTIMMTSLIRVDTAEGAVFLLKQLSRIASISTIFCTGMDEDGERMRNLEEASRQVVPGLQQFVILLGEGSTVYESRARCGLPVCSIQSDSPLHQPAHILPYLTALLANNSPPSRLIIVSDMITADKTSALVEQKLLPDSLDEVKRLGLSLTTNPKFTEVVTLSPRYDHSRHSLLPVFLVPGLGVDSIHPLVNHLLHPAFSCAPPVYVKSVILHAENLLQEILKIQQRGLFNIVADWLGCAVGLQLAHLLESRGHQVELFLLGSSPSMVQDSIRTLCDEYSADLGSSLLTTMLNLPIETSNMKSWDEALQVGLGAVEGSLRGPVARALTSVYSQLTALTQWKPSSQLFKGRLTVITSTPLSASDTAYLSELCYQTPMTVTVDSEHYRQLIASRVTASTINENMAHDWNI